MPLQEEGTAAAIRMTPPSVESAPPETTVDAPPKFGLALLVIATAEFMLVLDDTIMNVALPNIQKSLHLAPGNLNWVITAYALTFGGLLLVGGRSGDLFGRKTVFRIGLVVFTIASLLGGLATTGALLIGARLLQGVGAAIAAPTAMSLLATTFPPGPARNKALGVYGAMGGLGSVAGLLLGGALTEFLSWRWVLFINVPIAILVLIGTTVLAGGQRDRGRVDLPGAITATLGFGSLIYAINRISTHSWSDTQSIGFLIAALVLLAAFVIIQRVVSTPMVPGKVVRDRSRAGANTVMFLVGAGMLAMFYFLTLYMQTVREFTAVETGLAFLPFALGIGLSAGGIGPKLLGKLSSRGVLTIGLILAVGGTVWLSTLTPNANPLAALLPAQLVAGLGLGLAFVTITIVGVRGIAPQDTGVAAGLINTNQQIGGAVGLAALAAVAESVAASMTARHTATASALTGGYTTGFLVGGALYLVALVVGVMTINARLDAPH